MLSIDKVQLFEIDLLGRFTSLRPFGINKNLLRASEVSSKENRTHQLVRCTMADLSQPFVSCGLAPNK